MEQAAIKEAKITQIEKIRNFKRTALAGLETTRAQRKKVILEQKTERHSRQKL